MAKKKVKEVVDDPLEALAPFHPDSLREAETAGVPAITSPVSPLGPPTAIAAPAAVELLLREANRQIRELRQEVAAGQTERRQLEKRNYQLEAIAAQVEELRAALDQERQVRSGLERETAAMEVEVKHVARLQAELEAERAARLELERQTAMLTIRAERADEVASLLAEERQARVTLERERATLAVEVEQARKMEVFLAEERQARMNAQSRAASAEARLAKLEGEVEARNPQGERSLMGRLRGR